MDKKNKRIDDLPIEERVLVSKVADDLTRYRYALEGVRAYLEWEKHHKDEIPFTQFLRARFSSFD